MTRAKYILQLAEEVEMPATQQQWQEKTAANVERKKQEREQRKQQRRQARIMSRAQQGSQNVQSKTNN